MSVLSSTILVCLYAMLRDTRLITIAQGFDEFMNIVFEDAAEVYVKDAKPRRELGACGASQTVAVYSFSFSFRSHTAKRRQHHAHSASCLSRLYASLVSFV